MHAAAIALSLALFAGLMMDSGVVVPVVQPQAATG